MINFSIIDIVSESKNMTVEKIYAKYWNNITKYTLLNA
jgi:hypothetical protein